jgi:hypothetical protein
MPGLAATFRSTNFNKRFLLAPLGLILALLLLKSNYVMDYSMLLPSLGLAIAYIALKHISSLKQNYSAMYISGLFTFILISFVFPISNTNRWVTVTFVCSLLLLFHPISISEMYKLTIQALTLVLGIHLLLPIAEQIQQKVLQFSLLGYDNALHFSLFRYYRSEEVFPFGYINSWGTDFEQFLNYPAGQAAIWSFLSMLIIGNSKNPDLEFLVFNVLYFATFTLLVLATYKIIRTSSRMFFDSRILVLGFSIIINFSLFGVIVSNGFPPYLLGTMVLNLFILGFNSSKSLEQKIFITSSTVFVLALVAPLFIAFLSGTVIYLGWKIIKLIKTKKLSFQSFIVILIPITFLLLILWFNARTTSKFGWRQVLADGGIHPPNLFASIILTIFSLVLLFKQRKFFMHNSISLVFLSGGTSVALFCGLTLSYTGKIQYYAIKQSYIFLQIAAMVVLIAVCRIALISKMMKLSLHLLVCIAIMIPVFKPSIYTGGFMGTLPKALAIAWDENQWRSQIMHPVFFDKIRDFKFSSKMDCAIVRYGQFPSDLSSRWANALSSYNNITNNCFDGFWNIDTLTPLELLDRLESLKGNFVLFTDEPGVYTGADVRIQIIKVD